MKKLMLLLAVLPAFSYAQSQQQCRKILHDVMEVMVYPGVCPAAPAAMEDINEETVYNLMGQAESCEAVFEGQDREKMQAELDAEAVKRSKLVQKDQEAFCRSQIQRAREAIERYRK
ncbi:hypothetical protein L1281_000035 [Neisseria sp. HSC-16F19]|nr:hypothetical protein [Neisseria sp. HSC-16F19]MCP2039470.1 hypothetical protein [Neisseria sp. HSC-16F19]